MTRGRRLIAAAVLAAIAVPWTARAATPSEPAAPPVVERRQPESLGQILFEKTNWIGHLFYATLAVFSVAAMAVAFERLARVRRPRIVPRGFVDKLRSMLVRGEDSPDLLRRLCDGSESAASRVLAGGLLRAGRPLPEVEKAMEDAAAREMAEIRGRNRILSVLASVAPLVGLHGTVVGMIFAFRTSSLEGMGRAELLAEGIYLALLTTAAGLTIAIPCLLLAAWFNHKADRLFREVDAVLGETLPSFARMERPRP